MNPPSRSFFRSCLLLAIAAPLAAGGPPPLLWDARFDAGGTPFATDVLSDLAAGPGGVLCATGASVTTGGAFAAATVLYDTDGTELWRRFYTGPQSAGNEDGMHVAFGPDGSCIVTGEVSSTVTGSQDVMVLRYDAAGQLLWDVGHDEGSGFDTPAGVAVDAAGNVFVAAQSDGAGTGWDILLLKFDAAGVEQWSRVYDGPIGGDDVPVGVAVDASGNVYVAGTAAVSNPFGDEVVVRKFDTDGNELWTELVDGGANGTDVAGAMALDPAGNVFVAARLLPPPGNEWVAAVVKLLPDGAVDWVGSAGHPSPGIPENVRGLAVDAAGGAAMIFTGSNDVLVARFDAAGAFVWDHLYDGVSVAGFAVRPLALDALGNAYVAAHDFAAGNGQEFLLYRLEAADGSLAWETTYGETGESADDAPVAIVVDGLGGLLVAGTVEPGGQNFENDWAVVEYDVGLMFADGFESGDTAAWSLTVP